MSTFDIRNSNQEVITKITFAEECSEDNYHQAYYLKNYTGGGVNKYFAIGDSNMAVMVHGKQHALDLIKAIEKAIELEWVK